MARKSKKLSVDEADDFVQDYFEEIKDVITTEEFAVLTEGYECLRQLVVPGNYSEVAMSLVTAILSRKGENVTLDGVINDVVEYPLIKYAITESVGKVSLVRLRELTGEDAAYVNEETEEVVTTNKHLVKKASTKK